MSSPDSSSVTFGASSGSEEGQGSGGNAMAVPAIADQGQGSGGNAMAVPAIADQAMQAIEDQHPIAIPNEDANMTVAPAKSRSTSSRRGTVFYIEDDKTRAKRPVSTPRKTGRSASPRSITGGASSSSPRSQSLKPVADDKFTKQGRDLSGRARSVSRTRKHTTQDQLLESILNPVPVDAAVMDTTNGADSGDVQRHEQIPPKAKEHGTPEEKNTTCPQCEINRVQLEREEFLRKEERAGYQRSQELTRKQSVHFTEQIRLLERHVEELERSSAEAEQARSASDQGMREEAKRFKDHIAMEAIYAKQKFANMEHENHVLKDELNVAMKECEAQKEVFMDLRSELSRSLESRTAKDETIARLERYIKSSSENEAADHSEVVVRLAKTETSLRDVQNDLLASTAEIAKLRGQNEEGQKALNERSVEINGLRSKILETEQRSHETMGRLRDTETLLHESQREMLSSKNQLEDGSIVFTREQAEKLRQRQEEHVARIHDLEQRLENCIGGQSAMENDNKALKDRLDALDRDNKDLKNRLDGANNEKLLFMEEHRAAIARHEDAYRRMVAKYENEQSVSHKPRAQIASSTTNLTGASTVGKDGGTEASAKPGSSSRAVSFDDGSPRPGSRNRSVGHDEVETMMSNLKSDLLREIKSIVTGGPGGPPDDGGDGQPGRGKGTGEIQRRGRSPTVRNTKSRDPPVPGDPDDGGGYDDEDHDEGEEEEEEEWETDSIFNDGASVASRSDSMTRHGHRLLVKKGKEAESLKVPAFPTMANLVNWRIQIGETLCAASAYDDTAEIFWFNEAGRDTATFESLADSGGARFRSLDLKLAAAMNTMLRSASNEFNIEVTLKKQDAEAEGKMLTGRQITWMIFKHYQCNPSLQQLYTIRDLTDLKLRDGDQGLWTFNYMWQSMLKHMGPNVMNEDLLRETLFGKIQFSPLLASDIGHYHRQKEGDPDRSYAFLIRSITSYLARASQHKHQSRGGHFEAQMRAGGKALAAPEGDPNSKKAKAKAKKAAAKKAKAEAEKADKALAAKGNPKGKGGKGGKGQPNPKAKGKPGDKPKPVCYFYNFGGCSRDPCRFKHVKLSAKEAAKLTKPQSRAPSTDGQQTPRPSPSDQPKKEGNMQYCRDFLKEGTCKKGDDCKFAHWTEDIVRDMKRVQSIRNKAKKT